MAPQRGRGSIRGAGCPRGRGSVRGRGTRGAASQSRKRRMSGDADESKRRKTKGNGGAAGSEGLPGPSTTNQVAMPNNEGTPTQAAGRLHGRPSTPGPNQQLLSVANNESDF